MSEKTEDPSYDFVVLLAERIGFDTENDPVWLAWNRMMRHLNKNGVES